MTLSSLLTRVTEAVGPRPEIYTVYPALIDTMGDLGSIVGSIATTKLALGTIEPSLPSIKQNPNEIFGAWAASFFMFISYSIISSLTHGIFTVDRLLSFTAILCITNILAALFMVAIAYTVAIRTYRRGWDPDNFVIPIESSLADTITTISLLIALKFVGW